MARGALAVGHCHSRLFFEAGMHEANEKKTRFGKRPASRKGLYAH